MYIVSFYDGTNGTPPSGWPSELKPFPSPPYISGLGYQLRTGDNAYYNGELTSKVINSDKAGFGIGESQSYMTQNEFIAYRDSNFHIYNEWRNSVKNPQIRDETIKQIKSEAQRRIVEPLGAAPHELDKWITKQLNYTARYSELQDIYRINRRWTAQEETEYNSLMGLWAKIKSIRNHSNVLENYVNSGINVDIYSGWPS